MAKLVSCVSSGSVTVIACLTGAVASLPCALQVTTRWRTSRTSDSVSSTAAMLSGLLPERPKEISSSGCAGSRYSCGAHTRSVVGTASTRAASARSSSGARHWPI
ncbi:hypothetical protein QE438_000073 [Pseudoxanthomonas sp. SORGH_AS 997]|nr:hypothetical protein [Pseudoxanthomonas sp. SORGH_AS_0997]